MVRKCDRCNKIIDIEANFCPFCGEKLPIVAPQNEISPFSKPINDCADEEEYLRLISESEDKIRVGLIVLIIGFVTCCGLFLGIYTLVTSYQAYSKLNKMGNVNASLQTQSRGQKVKDRAIILFIVSLIVMYVGLFMLPMLIGIIVTGNLV